jgi:hypothetical protein
VRALLSRNPLGVRRVVRIEDSLDIGSQLADRSSDLRPGRCFPPVTQICYRLSRSQVYSATGSIVVSRKIQRAYGESNPLPSGL